MATSAKAGGTARGRPLVLSDGRSFDSQEVEMADVADVAIEEEEILQAPERGSVEELLDAGAHDALDAMRHSTAHVMAEAVLDLFPEAKLGIGPAIEGGFYYDFELPRALTPADLEAIEERMRASVAADHAFVRREIDFGDARSVEEGRGQAFKV